jgi:hypothetical protein
MAVAITQGSKAVVTTQCKVVKAAVMAVRRNSLLLNKADMAKRQRNRLHSSMHLKVALINLKVATKRQHIKQRLSRPLHNKQHHSLLEAGVIHHSKLRLKQHHSSVLHSQRLNVHQRLSQNHSKRQTLMTSTTIFRSRLRISW